MRMKHAMFYAFIEKFLENGDGAYTNVYAVDTRQGEAPSCPKCNRVIGMLPRLPPIRVEIELFGYYFGDVAFRGTQLLVSSRLRDLLIKSQLTGLYDFNPVEIIHVKSRKRKLRNECPIYFLANVKRSRAAIDTAASEFEYESGPVCSECRRGNSLKRWSRIIIEPGTWSGEAIFYPRGLNEILVTEQFREMYIANGLRNGVFIPAEEFGHDFYPWEKEASSDAN